MANDITALRPTAFSAAKIVQDEPKALLDSINMGFDDKGVAIGDKVTVPVAPAAVEKDYVPSMSTAAGDDKTAEAIEVEITSDKMVDWNLNGEQIRSLENGDTDQEWQRQLLQQGMRTLRNAAEVRANQAVYPYASRAYGVAGTTPFSGNIDLIAEALKGMEENGAPISEMSIVMNSAAAFNARKLGIIQQADQAGSSEERRTGKFLPQFGFQLKVSAGVQNHIKGTGTLYVVNNAPGYVIGDQDIVLGTGSGTVLTGDVVTFAGDTNQYVTRTGIIAPGSLELQKTGLLESLAHTTAMTIGDSYTANLALERSAVVGTMRPPSIPDGNMNMQKMLVSDENGLTYLFVQVVGDGMITWRLHLAYGFKVVNPEFLFIIQG